MLTAWQPHLLLAKSPVTSNKDPTPGARWSQRIERVLRDCLASVFKQGMCKPSGAQGPISLLGYIQGQGSGRRGNPKVIRVTALSRVDSLSPGHGIFIQKRSPRKSPEQGPVENLIT